MTKSGIRRMNTGVIVHPFFDGRETAGKLARSAGTGQPTGKGSALRETGGQKSPIELHGSETGSVEIVDQLSAIHKVLVVPGSASAAHLQANGAERRSGRSVDLDAHVFVIDAGTGNRGLIAGPGGRPAIGAE